MPANLANYKIVFVNTKNEVEQVHFSKTLLMIKNAGDYCLRSSMIVILSRAKFEQIVSMVHSKCEQISITTSQRKQMYKCF